MKPLRPGDQELPVVNGHPGIQPMVMQDLAVFASHTASASSVELTHLVLDDIAVRTKVGIERYGTPLQPHNGRDVLTDAYEEALDLLIYLKQGIVEGHNLALLYSSTRSIVLELRAQLRKRKDIT